MDVNHEAVSMCIQSWSASHSHRYRANSVTLIILRSCLAQKRMRSGRRAMSPSSFTISQITPEGFNPPRRARSTAASVWPRRSNTPSRRARSGKMWPGLARSSGRVLGSIAARIVWERSYAEIPVLTPRRFASIETVKAVPPREVFLEAIRSLTSNGEADQPPCMSGHKVDDFWRDHLRGDHEIALVLAVFIVSDHDHAPSLELYECITD